MMYTMPKNLLSICVNFALATQLRYSYIKTAMQYIQSENRIMEKIETKF